jgi:hypothetical protein
MEKLMFKTRPANHTEKGKLLIERPIFVERTEIPFYTEDQIEAAHSDMNVKTAQLEENFKENNSLCQDYCCCTIL